MKTYTLNNGATIPAIGLGTFGSDRYQPQEIAEAVCGAIKAGYRLIDCASVYGNEAQIGEQLERAITDGLVARQELTVISKVWNDMHGPGDVLLSCAKTLRDLRLDYLDVFMLHWPFPNHHASGVGVDSRDPHARPFIAEEYLAVWRQMERLVDMDLVKSIAMSNMTIPKLEALLPHCRIRPALAEMELHPAFQQWDLFNYCISKNIRPVGFCPIGSPNRPDRDKTSEDIAATDLPAVKRIAAAHGVHPAAICVKWGAQRGEVVIPFSVHEKNYTANLRAVYSDPLTEAEMAEIAAADAHCRLIKGQVFLWPGAADWHSLWDENPSDAQ